MVRNQDELISKLCEGKHKVSLESGVDNARQIKERIKDGFVFGEFTKTNDGTGLGIDLIPEECCFDHVDFTKKIVMTL